MGTARLLPDGHIGRMAVLKEWRNRGIGALMLRGLIERAKQRGDREVALSAQVHAVPFYRAHGFVEEGDEYLEAGIRAPGDEAPALRSRNAGSRRPQPSGAKLRSA